MKDDKNRKVLLLGGTGAMGVYLVPELLRLGYQVSVTSRSERRSNEKNLRYIRGDAKDDAFLKNILSQEEYDAIIDFMVYHTDEFHHRVELLLKNTAHYIFLSSYRVYADSGHQPLTEKSPRLLDTVKDEAYLKTDEYGLAKARQEDILMNSKQKNWTIVRPAITYSKDRFQLGTMEADEFLHRALKGKAIIFPREMLDKVTTMSWAGDVAMMIARLTLQKDSFGEAYMVATSESHKWREIVDMYKRILGVKIKIIPLNEYKRVIGRPYQIEYDRMYDRSVENEKILAAVGMKQSDLMPLKDGLRMELANFSRAPKFANVDSRKDKIIDTLTTTSVQKVRARVAPMTRLRQAKALVSSHFRYDGAIVSLGGYYNYGGLMQRYALQSFLRENGYTFKVFNLTFMLKMGKRVGDRKNLVAFAKKYIDEEVFDPRLSRFHRTYIVGSDQVWRDWFGDWNKFGIFFLKFVRGKNVKRIAYAASFGIDDLNGAGITSKNKKKIIPLVKRFKAISVREKSAEKLVKELEGEAVTNLDPTLLLTSDDYSKLIDVSSVKDKETSSIFCYLLDTTELKESLAGELATRMDASIEGIRPNNGKRLPKVERWLKGFRDSEIVITDSFHGIVFSIINKTPFIAFGNKVRGMSRITDLLEPLGLEGRIIDENNDINSLDLHGLLEPINWQKVDKVLDEKRKESSRWLLEALKSD